MGTFRKFLQPDEQNASIGSSLPRFSLALSSDFDKFLRSPITPRHPEIPRDATLSLGIKRDRSPIVGGIAVSNRDFFPESPSTYRRPSPSALSAKRLETRGALWSISIQWKAQYCPSRRLSRLLDSKWKMVRDEMGGFPAATRTARFQNVADRLSAR